MRVYKFYSKKWALDALAKKRLKISTLHDLNDPFEFIYSTSRDSVQRKIWHKAAMGIFESNGLISFSKSWSNPVIWSHYGENHRGAALGFDVSDDWLWEVSYRSKRNPLPDLNLLSDAEKIELFRKSVSTKYLHWKYEKEYRVFVELNTPDNGLFFKEFDDDIVLKELIIGPKSDLSSDEVHNAFGADPLEITTSRLAFNTYSVVKQKHKSRQK